MGVGGHLHVPAALPLRRSFCTHCAEGWVDPGGRSARLSRRENLFAFIGFQTFQDVASQAVHIICCTSPKKVNVGVCTVRN